MTLPLVDGLEEGLRQGIDVLDVGCGHGRAINLMAQAYPASRFLGVDDVGRGFRRPSVQAGVGAGVGSGGGSGDAPIGDAPGDPELRPSRGPHTVLRFVTGTP